MTHPEFTPNSEEKGDLSKESAQKKLEVLMTPDFKRYGIRFINVREYESFASRGYLENKQFYVFGKESDPSFSKYLENNRDNWLKTMTEQTDYVILTSTLQTHNMLINFLRLAKQKASGQQLRNIQGIRAETMKEFKSLLVNVEKIGSESDGDILFEGSFTQGIKIIENQKRYYREFMTLLENLNLIVGHKKTLEILHYIKSHHSIEDISSYNLPHSLSYIVTRIGILMNLILSIEHIEMAQKFVESPENMTPKDVKTFINILSYKVVPSFSFKFQQYELAAVVNLEHYDLNYNFKYSLRERWLRLKEIKEIFGIIVIIPDKDLVKHVIQISSLQGEKAHPVFNTIGSTCYPR